jgi:putative tryptophan/tyrosine transport system substrate-binding protein
VRRRDFIKVIAGSAVVAWPLAASAQQPAMPVIGFLNSASPEGFAPQLAGFRQGLNEVGYTEGHNVAIEFRWAKSQYIDCLSWRQTWCVVMLQSLPRLVVASRQSRLSR